MLTFFIIYWFISALILTGMYIQRDIDTNRSLIVMIGIIFAGIILPIQIGMYLEKKLG